MRWLLGRVACDRPSVGPGFDARKQQGATSGTEVWYLVSPFCGQLAEFGIEWCQVWQFGTLPLVKLRSLVPENLHVRISDLVFLRSRGTKLRFLAEFGVPNFRSWKRAGAISRILSEKDGYRFIGR